MDARREKYDLEERTFLFAQRVRNFIRQLPRTACNENDVRQLARATGSVGANYIEANEALSKKDFRHRLRIARKECKESRYWLRLVYTGGEKLDDERETLIRECQELRSILSAILRKSE